MKEGSSFYRRSAILPLVVLAAVFLLPLLTTLSRAFLPEGSFSLSLIKEVFTDPYSYQLLFFTLKQALLSAVVSLLIAAIPAAILSNYTFPGRALILSLSSLCFILPSILVVLGFVIFYGNSGVLNTLLMKLFGLEEPPLHILYSFKAILLAHAFLNFPIALSLITERWSGLSDSQEKAARLLGGGEIRVFFTVTLPRILPAVISSFILIFLFCFTSFSIILVLGGGPKLSTLEVEIYRLNNISGDSSRAAAMAIFSLIVNFLILLIYLLLERRSSSTEKKPKSRLRKPEGLALKLFIAFVTIVLLTFILTPLISIVVRSFISTSNRYGKGLTLRSYGELFGLLASRGSLSSAFPALLNSLFIALSSALLAVILGLSISLYAARCKGTLISLIAMLPMAVSSVTIGLGYFLIRIQFKGQSLALSYTLIILAHLVMTLPFATRTLIPAARSLNFRIIDAARLLGAGDLKASLTVELPALRGAVIKAFIFSFSLSMGEVNATLTLSDGKIPTLPILLYRLINSYSYQGACTIGTILILTSFAVFLISEALEGHRRK